MHSFTTLFFSLFSFFLFVTIEIAPLSALESIPSESLTGLYFRSLQTGSWTSASSWECSTNSSGPWSNATAYPTNVNSDKVTIQIGHTINLNSTISIDHLIINGNFTIGAIGKITILDGNAAGADFEVYGKLKDAATSGNGLFFNGGTWLLGSAIGVVEKTNGSNVTNYRDYYHGGISNMPDATGGNAAHWFYIYDGSNVQVLGDGMYYPNLSFLHSSLQAHDWNAASEVFIGSGSSCTVKGDMNIWSGQTIHHNMGNSFIVKGDLINNGTIDNIVQSVSGAVTGYTLRVEGSIANSNGVIDFSSGTSTLSQGIIDMNGSSISTNGDNLICNKYMNDAGGNISLSGGNLIVEEEFNFTTSGKLNTGSREVKLQNTNSFAITGAYNESGTYINGRLRWDANTMGVDYTWPVGNNAAGHFVTLNFASAPGSYSNMLGYYTGSGCSNSDIACPNDGLYQWGSSGCCEGEWSFTPNGTTTGFNYTFNVEAPHTCSGTHYTYVKNNLLVDNTGNVTNCPNTTGQYNSFSTFEYWTTSSLLPVELAFFEATKHGAIAILDWRTLSEMNNAHFIVQRSFDGNRFTDISQIDGAGTTNIPQDYQFVDDAPQNGFNYYRLKQVDFDGAFEYSQVRVLDFRTNDTNSSLLVYPTIADKNVHIVASVSPDAASYGEIYDMMGKKVWDFSYDVLSVPVVVDVSALPPGHYFMRIDGQTGRFIKR